MRRSSVLFLWCVLCITTSVKGNSTGIATGRINIISQKIEETTVLESCLIYSDSMKAGAKDTISYHKKHRLVAALLAFPLGVFGLHRMYMHTAPIVPLVYIVTAGGLFGVLPFIDFVLILLNKDIHLNYTSNPHLFMWQKR